MLRSRFGDDEQALANIQIKYCRQWFTTALCHAKTKEACKDTISRLGMYILEPSRSHDFTRECQLQVADLMALVAPPCLSLDRSDITCLQRAVAAAGKPEHQTCVSLVSEYPVFGCELLAHAQEVLRNFESAQGWLLQAYSKTQAWANDLPNNLDQSLTIIRSAREWLGDPASEICMALFREELPGKEAEMARGLAQQRRTALVRAFVGAMDLQRSLILTVPYSDPPSDIAIEWHRRVGDLKFSLDGVDDAIDFSCVDSLSTMVACWASGHVAKLLSKTKETVAPASLRDILSLKEKLGKADPELRGGDKQQQDNFRTVEQWLQDTIMPKVLGAMEDLRRGPADRLMHFYGLGKCVFKACSDDWLICVGSGPAEEESEGIKSVREEVQAPCPPQSSRTRSCDYSQHSF